MTAIQFFTQELNRMKLPFADKDVTLYNVIEVRDEYDRPLPKLQRIVLRGCSWLKSDKKIQVDTVLIESDEFIVKIPYSRYFRNAWEFTGEMGTFTLRADDVLVLGVVEDEFDVGVGTSDVLEKYSNRSFAIKSFNDFTGEGLPLPHYQVTGK